MIEHDKKKPGSIDTYTKDVRKAMETRQEVFGVTPPESRLEVAPDTYPDRRKWSVYELPPMYIDTVKVARSFPSRDFGETSQPVQNSPRRPEEANIKEWATLVEPWAEAAKKAPKEAEEEAPKAFGYGPTLLTVREAQDAGERASKVTGWSFHEMVTPCSVSPDVIAKAMKGPKTPKDENGVPKKSLWGDALTRALENVEQDPEGWLIYDGPFFQEADIKITTESDALMSLDVNSKELTFRARAPDAGEVMNLYQFRGRTFQIAGPICDNPFMHHHMQLLNLLNPSVDEIYKQSRIRLLDSTGAVMWPEEEKGE